MPVTTARQRVLAHLRKQRSASAGQIGRALNMSAANVRHHLSILLSDGRIAMMEERKKEGRGRPVKFYRLSESLLGDNLALLSDTLLDEWLTHLAPAKRGGALRSLARALVSRMGQTSSQVQVAKRLASLVAKLNELHYQSRWEAGPEGPRVLFAHCPYAVIIEKHPELCKMDAAMLEALLGGDVRQTAKLEREGAPACVFVAK